MHLTWVSLWLRPQASSNTVGGPAMASYPRWNDCETAHPPASEWLRALGLPTGSLSVTLPGRGPGKLACERRRSGGDRTGGPACANNHGDDPGRPTSVDALVAGRTGVGAVDPDRARGGCDRLVRPPAGPGRPARVGAAERGGGSAGPLGGERGHGRGGAGRPSASSSGGLAPAGLRAGGPGAVQRGRRLRPLRAPGPTRNGARRQPRGRARLDHLRPQPGLDRVHPAAHPHRGAAVSPLALLGLDRGGPAGGVRAVVAVWDTTARPRFAVARGRQPVRHR